MKLFKNLFLPIALITAFTAASSNAMERSDKYLFQNYCEKFTPAQLKKYQVNSELKEALDERFKGRDIIHNPLVNTTRRITINNQNYFAKLDTSRIIGAELINELAQDYGLDTVKAPIKQMYTDLNRQEYVIVPCIQTTNTPFSLKQIQHIYKVIQQSAYEDIHRENIFNTAHGITYFLDTEKSAFAQTPNLKEWQNTELPVTLGVLKMQLPMTDEARAWLTAKMKKSAPSCC